METKQRILLAVGIVLIIIAIVVAVRMRPKPPEPYNVFCNKLGGRWKREDNDMRFTITYASPSAPDRECNVVFTWGDTPTAPKTYGYFLKTGDPNILYMEYAPGVVTKNKMLSLDRFAELNSDGSVAGYKSRVA